MSQRILSSWAIFSTGGTGTLTVRVWDDEDSVVGIQTVTAPSTAALLPDCEWSVGWQDNFKGVEVISIANGPVFVAPVRDPGVLDANSGITAVAGYVMGRVAAVPGQSATEPYGGGGSPGGSVAWGGITGTLSDQTDLQAALDAKADAGDAGISFGQMLIGASLGI